jgi:glycosyltransferase involved in cell wall biosynthesis
VIADKQTPTYAATEGLTPQGKYLDPSEAVGFRLLLEQAAEVRLNGAPEQALRRPPELIGRGCEQDALAYHCDELRRLLADGGIRMQVDARIRYHAQWLKHLLAPTDEGALPTVDVIIPVYNSAASIPRAIESVLAQTYPATRAIVVDDGSTDALDDAVAPFTRDAGRVLFVRKTNGGCASARNEGVRISCAEFVHFLDSDDQIDSDAIERKVQAMLLIPDAEVCCSSYRSCGEDPHRAAKMHAPTTFGDAFCPTTDLLHSAAYRYPFWTTTVLIPRWVFLRTGPMDEDMNNGSDMRYWFRLGLDHSKVIALDVPLATRHFRTGSLSSSSAAHQRGWAVNALSSILDILERPACWPWLGPYARLMMNPARWRWFCKQSDDQIQGLIGRLDETISNLPGIGERGGVSSRFPLLILRDELRRANRVLTPGASCESRFATRLLATVDEALARSQRLRTTDVRLWLTERRSNHGYRENRSAYADLLRKLATSQQQAVPRLTQREWERVSSWAASAPEVVRRNIESALGGRIGTVAGSSLAALCARALAVSHDVADWTFGLRSRVAVRSRIRALAQSAARCCGARLK